MKILLEVIRRISLVILYLTCIVVFGLELDRAGSLDNMLNEKGIYIAPVVIVAIHLTINFIFLKNTKRQYDAE